MHSRETHNFNPVGTFSCSLSTRKTIKRQKIKVNCKEYTYLLQINIQNLTFGYDGGYENVFEDVSFSIDTAWKLGFCGRNGRGKTTFLKLLMGEYEYSGTISHSEKFSYFPFKLDKKCQTIDVFGDCELWQIERELSKLEMDSDVLERPFETLSNGEQTKVLLAILFLKEHNFLLIDEPTNHLDTHSREIVARYLNGKKGFILVSHDRAFLDICTDHVLSINKANIEVIAGNFSTWWEKKMRQDAFEIAENEKLAKDIKRLKASARRASEWSDKTEKGKKNRGRPDNADVDKGFIGHKSAKMMSKSMNIQKRSEIALNEKKSLLKNIETAENLKISPVNYHAETLAVLDKISIFYGGKADWNGIFGGKADWNGIYGEKADWNGISGGKADWNGISGGKAVCNGISSEKAACNGILGGKADWNENYGDKAVCTNISFDIKNGDRIALAGKNGSGKSSVLKLILGEKIDFTGNLHIGSDLKISYVPQNSDFLCGSFKNFVQNEQIDETLFLTILRKFDFGREHFSQDMSAFSAGQKKKVLLANSLCKQANIYIWDEPLNYIDVYSRMQIENLILSHKPTLLFVEHDKVFCDKIATKVVEL
jgi:lincosamide and streptogramin A transport system ATP-binding/permease protein